VSEIFCLRGRSREVLLRTFSIAFKKAISSTSTAITAAAMGVASMLQIDEMLGDFNRMNKRQVSG